MHRKNIKAVIYARVSSKEQEQEGFSIPAQLKLLTSYAEKNGLSVLHEFVDVETAKQSGRQHFTEMVKFFEKEEKKKEAQNPCRVLLAEKTDRLYRNFPDYVSLDPTAINIEIHFVKENFILSRESRSAEKLIHGVKLLMAKNYIDNLSEETKKGMLEKAEQGIYPSQAPLGYFNVAGENGKRSIETDPDVAPLIERMFKWYSTGKYSLKGITDKIQKEGLNYRKSGKKIPKSVIHQILKNPIYYGSFLWKGKLYKGLHEPVISKDLYDHVQNMMLEKGTRRTRQQKHNWAFQGMLTCGHCGCSLTAEIQKGKYIYYHCTRSRGKCPGKKYVREEEIARSFRLVIQRIRLEDKVINWAIKALNANHHDEKRFHDNAISKLQREYEKYQNRIDGIYLDKLDGIISSDFYNQKGRAWREKQADILIEIKNHQHQTCLENSIQLIELIQKAVMLYDQQSMTEKRRLIDFVFSNSIWKDGILYPCFRKPFDMIVEAFSQKKNFVFDDGNSHDTFLISDLNKQIPNPVKTKKIKRSASKTRTIKNPVHEGFQFIQYLKDNPKATYDDLAAKKGITKARVCQKIALCKRLPKEITTYLHETDESETLKYFTERRLRPLIRMSSDLEKIRKFNQMKNDLKIMDNMD